MDLKKIWKKAKPALALLLVFALFFNGWATYDFSVFAAGELTVNLSAEEHVYTGNGINLPEITDVKEGDVSVTYDQAEWTNVEGSQVTEAGTYTLTVTKTEEDGTEKTGTATFTVTQLNLENCIVTAKDAEYTGNPIKPEVTVKTAQGETVNADVFEVKVGEESATEAGLVSFTVSPKEGNANVTGEYKGTFNITPKSLTEAMVTLTADSGFVNGSEHTVGVTVKDGEKELAPDTDYTVEFPKSMVQAGEYEITVTGKEKGNYEGSVTKKYVISYLTKPENAITLEGQTLKGDVYAGRVTVKPADGYTIGETEAGADQASLTFENSFPTVLFLKDSAGNICKLENAFAGKSFDNEPPKNLEITVDTSNDNWSAKKTITVSAEGADAGIYYSTVDDVIIENGFIQDVSGLSNLDGNPLIVKENILQGKVYYFYAIDNAGNVVKDQVTIDKIDVDKPTITIDSTSADGVYWKNANPLEIGVTAKDMQSGIKSVEVSGGAAEFIWESEVNLSKQGTLKISTAGDYEVTVTDNVGLEEKVTFTVKEDTSAPAINLVTPEGTNPFLSSDSVHWFSDQNVTVTLDIKNDPGNGEKETSPWVVDYWIDPNAKKTTESEKNEIALELSPGKTTYHFQVRDAAGNMGNVEDITFGYDPDAPVISGITLSQDGNGDEWINGEESTNGKITFSVEATDGAGAGIKEIFYTTKAETVFKEATYSFVDNKYRIETTEQYDDLEIYEWEFIVKDNVENVSDSMTVSAGIDRTAPEETAYIQFTSDTIGANDQNKGTNDEENGNWISKIYKLANEAWNKIWGKTKITYEIYVRDQLSGIETIEIQYNGQKAEAERIEGLKAFTESDTNNRLKGYTVYEGTISCPENETLEVRNFLIQNLMDKAGNVFEGPIWLKNIENQKIIYLDSVTPELSVSIRENADADSSEDTSGEGMNFYNKDQELVLTIKERFFAQEDDKAVYPKITLFTNGEGKELTEGADQWESLGNDEYRKVVPLSMEKGKETEYKIEVSSYADPSGNILTGKGVDKDGKFNSKTFVVDGIAPKLDSYTVNDPTDCTMESAVNAVPVYRNDKSNDDLQVTFVLDDHQNYFENSRDQLIVKLFKDGTEELSKKISDLIEKEVNGRKRTYSFTYDGDQTSENEFYVTISYQDAAGNAMIAGNDISEEKIDNGTYTSAPFIIDHVAPEFKIEYIDDAQNVVKNDNGTNAVDDDGKNVTKPLADHTAYYKGDIRVKITLDEKYGHIKEESSIKKKSPLEHFDLEVKKDGTTLEEKPEIDWSHDDSVHTAEFTIPADATGHTKDGNYQITVKYRDCAENAMVADDSLDPNMKDLMSTEGTFGVYTSPELVIDTTAPIVSTQYMLGEVETEPIRTADGIDYFQDQNTVFQISVKDRNIRYGELKTVLQKMKAADINGILIDKSVLYTAIEDIVANGRKCVDGNVKDKDLEPWTLKLPLQTEANYTIPVAFTDLAGNKAQINEKPGPFEEKVTVDATEPIFELSYSVTDPANYLKWGYLFAKGQLNIKVNAEDGIAGIWKIKFTVTDENGKETVKEKTFQPSAAAEYSVDIPLKSKNFKGSVLAEVFDQSANESEKIRGHIVESAEKHSETGKAVITTITSPSRNVGGKDFYNTDVKFKLRMEDTYSGLASWEYTGGETLKDHYNYKAEAGTDLSVDPKKEITYSYEKELILSAARNNKNDVPVKASYVDNAGHTNEVEQQYNIDITKPEIEVTYDLNEPANDKYYKETRTATVKIRERNFDSSDVEFLITSTDGPQPEIGGWTSSGSGDDTIHVCTLAFAQDSDYTFTVKFQDMAGNVADYNRVDEFTIDKTIPVATVTYDNNHFLNEYYYDAARTATIDILEHNFDPGAIDVMITAEGDPAVVPGLSSWVSNGDHNIATVTFSADGEYTFDIAGLDLALNEMEDYTPDHFVVDQTAPELEIFDIEHMSANNSVVRPGIRYYDTNYDPEGTVILMTGYHNGVVEMTGARKLEPNGLELKLDDFAYEQKLDDLYTMNASVYDLAGNSSEETVMFSVNRFGSVYTFDEATDALIGDHGKYYTNKEQDLVITETNVDTLEFQEITCNLNGRLTTLEEGKNYLVSRNGNEATWKQYTYTVFAENFKEEGSYLLNIYSEDRATNPSDNRSKGKKIEFVVDKTSPRVLISGVEEHGQYRENSREMTVDIEDNVSLSRVSVFIDGVETVYDAKKIQEVEGKFVLEIGSANYWQEIQVVATDVAGNETVSEKMQVLVTSNALIQFLQNRALFYGSLAMLLDLEILAGWIILRKHRVSDEESHNS